MQELFPLLAGALAGLAVQLIRGRKLKAVVLVALCLLLGMTASYLSGELAVSWGFVSIDTVLVWVGALLALILAALVRRRAALHR